MNSLLHVLVDIILNHFGNHGPLRRRFSPALSFGALGMNQLAIAADTNFKVARHTAVFQAFNGNLVGQVLLLFQPSLQPPVILAVASPTAVLDLDLDFAHDDGT